MARLVILAATLVLASALRLQKSDQELEYERDQKPANKTRTLWANAHVFVLNKEGNKGRCECMSAQFFASKIPYSVSRIQAATKESMHQECPESKVNGLDKLGEHKDFFTGEVHDQAEGAIYCSNHKAWEEAAKNHKDKDFIIIFEDDSKMQWANLPHFWEKVDDLLKSDCQYWDHVMVDPYPAAIEAPVCANTKWGQSGNSLQKASCCGAHMQIIRTKHLPHLIERSKVSSGIMDRVDTWMSKDTRRFTWSPNIVTQFNYQYAPARKLYKFCSSEVLNKQNKDKSKIKQTIVDAKQKAAGYAFAC